MINLTYNDMVSSREYYDNISTDKRVFFDYQRTVNTIEIERAMANTDKQLSIDSLQVCSGEGNINLGDLSKFGGSYISRNVILNYLSKEVGSKQYLLYDYHSNKQSLNMENVLIPLLERGIACEFLEPFIAFRKHNKAAKDMSKKLSTSFSLTDIDGIMTLRYQWNKALTGRYYTEHENIQNINKLYHHCMRGETDDYLLVWGDFDQLDLRVSYYTVTSESKEDDEIFEKYDDKYEAFARIIDKKLGRKFNLNNFKDNRKKYKRGILARCYGQTLKRLIGTVGDKDFAIMLDKYYNENDRYTKWYNSVEHNVSINDFVDIYTYFGNVCHVNFESGLSKEKRLDRTLNCPIQGTSNDIVMHTVNKTVMDFRKEGISEDKFRVYMVRHDEPIYMIHKSVLEYLPIIKNNTSLQIDDWGPITMSLDIGRFYTESEYDKYKKYFGDKDINVDRIVVPRPDEYNPFNKQEIKMSASIKIDGYTLMINDDIRLLDSTVHKQFQIHSILAEYAKNNNTATAIFDVEQSDIKLYDVFVDGVYVYFNDIGEAV